MTTNYWTLTFWRQIFHRNFKFQNFKFQNFKFQNFKFKQNWNSLFEIRLFQYVPPESRWTPPAHQWLPSQHTYQPQHHLDITDTGISDTGSSISPTEAAVEDNSPMKTLLDMGFADRPRNQRLLEKHQGDVGKVVADIISEDHQDWPAQRHWNFSVVAFSAVPSFMWTVHWRYMGVIRSTLRYMGYNEVHGGCMKRYTEVHVVVRG